MKGINCFIIFILSFNLHAQQSYYSVNAGNGNGLRFWNSNDYKIHMGNTSEYRYGPVSDYSIKMNMNDSSNRGWTWGVIGATPIAALSTLGDFQVARNLFALGKIGIGTTTPQYNLHVIDGAQISKSTFGVTIGTSENEWIRDGWLTGNYGPAKWNQSLSKWIRPSGTYNDIGGIVWQDEGTYFIREKAGTELEYTNVEFLKKAFMFAHISTGNVGIGTISPDERLSVNGKIHSKEVRVDLDNWSDFVFEEGYNLPTLKEVEHHIKDKGHLKDIPSVKEVTENGIFLGEMDAKLLQKIEELTLYIIGQEKRIHALEVRNEKLSLLLKKN